MHTFSMRFLSLCSVLCVCVCVCRLTCLFLPTVCRQTNFFSLCFPRRSAGLCPLCWSFMQLVKLQAVVALDQKEESEEHHLTGSASHECDSSVKNQSDAKQSVFTQADVCTQAEEHRHGSCLPANDATMTSVPGKIHALKNSPQQGTFTSSDCINLECLLCLQNDLD